MTARATGLHPEGSVAIARAGLAAGPPCPTSRDARG
jgi:hypothetical protein